MSAKLIPSDRSNPCPLCGDITGKDRSNGDIWMCMALADVRSGEIIDGYKVISHSKDRLWAVLKPDTTVEWTQEHRPEWEAQKVARQQKAREEEEEKREQALSNDERHELYSQILEQLPLDSVTITDLRRRNFDDEQISRSGFKFAKKWQRLNKSHNLQLPGIGENGKSLIVSEDGYLQPVTDVYGRIVGLQLRVHKPQDDNRYRWLSNSLTPVHTKEFSELPLAVRVPKQLKAFDIQLVEGTGTKPFLAAERMGKITVGASGGLHTASPETLKQTIETIHQALSYIVLEHGLISNHPDETKTSGNRPNQWLYDNISNALKTTLNSRDLTPNIVHDLKLNPAESLHSFIGFTIVPDAGFALNRNVANNLVKTSRWLSENFPEHQVFVSDWNQIHKSQGDIDELSDLSIIRNLKIESFFKKYREVFCLDGDENGQGFVSKRYLNWAESRVKLTADIVQDEKWLTIPKGIQNECDILLIRKALGGGKTQGLIDFLKPLNKTSLLVGYRNSLLNNTISRAKDMGLNALHIKDTFEKVGGSYVNFAADDSVKLWGGCADSFFKFNAITDRNPDYYFIHDEVCSVLGHLKGGGTLKGRQQQAIEWDVNTINNSQFSTMMDANLSDREVNFIRELFPDKKLKVLDSVSTTNPRTFYFVETESSSQDYTMLPKYLPSQLMEKAKAANRVLWISDSQRSCEIADEILTGHGHKHFRLDGKTSHDELSKQLQSSPKQFITTEKLDSLSLSPSAESGLSIDLYNYFDCVCFDIRGTVSVNTLTQLSARLRDTNVPIYVACPEFVNMTSDPCPYAMKKVEEVISQRIEMLLAQAMEIDGELVDSQFVTDMFTGMGQKFAQDPWFIESLKDAKELKYEHSNLKLTLKTALAQAGHRIIDLIETTNEVQYEEVQQAKEMVKRREAEKIFNSEDINWEKVQELSKKDVDYDTKCKIRKARLRHKLPGIEETESWNTDFVYTTLVDQPQFLDKRWRLKQLQNEELAKAVFKSEKKYNFESGFTPQDVWKSTSTKIEALKLLGVGKIIEAGVFSSQDDWVQAIVNEYYDNPDWFKLIGIPKAARSLNSDGSFKNLRYVKEMVNRFLDYFGLESKQSKKIRSNRTYTVVTPDEFKDYLPDIDKCLDQKAKTILEETREMSLREIADKAEEARRQQQEWEQQQAELNKRMLEAQLTQTDSDLGTTSHSIYIKPKKSCPPTEVLNISTTEIEEWSKPETIADVAQMLECCQSSEMLAMLRECDIPVEIFKVAARNLSCEKREQIRQWVEEQNSA